MRPSITNHAADQYVARVKPHLTRKQAIRELIWLCEGREPVESMDFVRDFENFDAYLELSEGIALGLRWRDEKPVAVTLLTRGENNPVYEEIRREKRARKHRRRNAKRRELIDAKVGRSRRPEVSD